MSEQTGQLAKALAELQSRCGGLKRSAYNAGFHSNYSNLADCWSVVRPHLVELGLSVTLWPVSDLDQRRAGVEAEVAHTGGESRVKTLMLPVGGKGDAHACGSAITYAKRYMLLGIAGLAEDDDDGNTASGVGPQSRSSNAQRTNASRTGNQSTRVDKARQEPLRREDIPPEALSVYESMLRVDQAEAERFGRWASGPGKAGGPEVLAKGVEQAREVLADLCGHKHWEATGDVTACARCGFVRPDDEEPESMADALGVAEEEVPF